jgi:hypothetical protein
LVYGETSSLLKLINSNLHVHLAEAVDVLPHVEQLGSVWSFEIVGFNQFMKEVE